MEESGCDQIRASRRHMPYRCKDAKFLYEKSYRCDYGTMAVRRREWRYIRFRYGSAGRVVYHSACKKYLFRLNCPKKAGQMPSMMNRQCPMISNCFVYSL